MIRIEIMINAILEDVHTIIKSRSLKGALRSSLSDLNEAELISRNMYYGEAKQRTAQSFIIDEKDSRMTDRKKERKKERAQLHRPFFN